MALTNGTRLGPYEIIAPLGAGGMGEVYRARDTRLDRTVAIKVLASHLIERPDARQRFDREARAISSLQHPCICTLHDVGRQDGVDFLVMEYLEGETLAKRIAKGPLPLDQLLKCGIEICAGLDKAHRSGVVHRDLKPGNIILTRTGAKLLDFGLAKPLDVAPIVSMTTLPTSSKMIDASPARPLTAEGSFIGTFQYMAPEQLEGHEADERSDIFSLGAVLYEMATGKRAFDGKSTSSVVAAILERDPPPISQFQHMSPPSLDRVVKICLAKDPDDRWQSAHDVELQLKWMAEAGSQAGVAVSAGARRSRAQFAGWVVAAICLLAGITLAAVIFLRAPEPAPSMRSSLLPPQGSAYEPYNFAVSPDGSRLAFVALGPDGQDTLWLRSLAASGAQQVSGTEGASFPFWSPDSRRIGFFAKSKLKEVDIASGAVEILADALGGRGGTWNDQGTILFAPEIFGRLLTISERGGLPAPATKISRPGSAQAHRWPSFLPDGKHFLFTVDWSSPDDSLQNGMYVGSLDSPDTKLVSSELGGNVYFVSGYLLYVHERNLMAQPFNTGKLQTTGPAVPVVAEEIEKHMGFSESGFSVSRNGLLFFQSAADSASRLVWYDSAGKELGHIPESGYQDPNISPDGRFLAVSSDDDHNGKYSIRVYDLKRGLSTLVTHSGRDQVPVWSPDGKQIAFGANAGLNIPISEVPADGSASPHALLNGIRIIPCDWSADGHLVFMDFSTGLPSLKLYSVKDQKVTPFAPRGAEAQFSPDGKWIAYTGIAVQPFPGPGPRTQISNVTSSQPRWSHDGKQIFYIQPDRKLMAVSFDPRSGIAGVPHLLFQTRIVAPDYDWLQYAVAPDGRFLINSLPANLSSPLTQVTNWPARLKK
jgi:eukaryotic-like serine/threonine-protein kinase